MPSLSDELDISRQSRSLCARGNMLKRNFYACSYEVKIKLFQAYCSCLYTSQLWSSYTKSCINKFTVCYNNAFRCVLGYPRGCSASGMFVWNSVESLPELRRRIVHNFLQRVTTSDNGLVKHMSGCDMRWLSSLWCKWSQLLYL